jgi:hypothetical protein
MYGIPNMKLDKDVVRRRIKLMKAFCEPVHKIIASYVASKSSRLISTPISMPVLN